MYIICLHIFSSASQSDLIISARQSFFASQRSSNLKVWNVLNEEKVFFFTFEKGKKKMGVNIYLHIIISCLSLWERNTWFDNRQQKSYPFLYYYITIIFIREEYLIW